MLAELLNTVASNASFNFTSFAVSPDGGGYGHDEIVLYEELVENLSEADEALISRYSSHVEIGKDMDKVNELFEV